MGITPAICWHTVSGDDLDIGHTALAGQRLTLEGQDLLPILDFRVQILDLRAWNLGVKHACGLNLQSTIYNPV